MKEKRAAGYMTVEVSLLFPVIMIAMVCMIFLSFYCYDRCIMEQCAYAAALRGSSNRFADTQEAYDETFAAAQELIEHKLFAVKQIHTTVRVSGLKVTVSYECEINMPFGEMLKRMTGEEGWCMEVSKSMPRNKTVAILRGIQ